MELFQHGLFARFVCLVDALVKRLSYLCVFVEDIDSSLCFGDNRITLTTCHPKFSNAQRMIIHAVLVRANGTGTVTISKGTFTDSTKRSDSGSLSWLYSPGAG